MAQLPAREAALTTVNMPCVESARHLPEQDMVRILDSAGDERFRAKAATFQAALAQGTAAQVLYRGIMAALGYGKNKLPFVELAEKVQDLAVGPEGEPVKAPGAEEAVAALVALGYSFMDADRAVRQAIQDQEPGSSEELIRKALSLGG